MKLVTGMPRSGTSWLTETAMNSSKGYGEHKKQEPNDFYWLSEPAALGRGLRYWSVSQVRAYLEGLSQAYPPQGDKEPILKHHFVIEWLPEILDLFSSVCVCLRKPESWILSAQEHDNTKKHTQHTFPWYTPNFELAEEKNLRQFGRGMFQYCERQISRLSSQGLRHKLTVFYFNQTEPSEALEHFLQVPRSEAKELAESFTGSRFESKGVV